MKVLLVNGGPHKNGATNRALTEIAVTLRKEGIGSEIFWIGNDPIAGCIGCGACRKDGKCFRDDAVNRFNSIASGFDGFVFGSPVHYAAISGAMSSFMDRVFYSGDKNIFYMKPAAAAVSCRRGGASAAFDEINKYFTISCMPIVSSQYWNQIHGNSAEEAEKDEEGLQTMRTLAKNMAFMLKCFEAGKSAGINVPEKEAAVKTNFIR